MACHLKTLAFRIFAQHPCLISEALTVLSTPFCSRSPFNIFGLLLVIVSAWLKSLFLSPFERAQFQRNAAL